MPLAQYKPNPDVEVWRLAATALCEYACGYAEGRSKLDPVYREVTENRDGPSAEARAKYSSCADLGWWLLDRLGFRRPWTNRASRGTFQWGRNVSDFTGCPIAHAPKAMPEAGDILEIWSAADTHDAHVCVVLDGNRIANYGAA